MQWNYTAGSERDVYCAIFRSEWKVQQRYKYDHDPHGCERSRDSDVYRYQHPERHRIYGDRDCGAVGPANFSLTNLAGTPASITTTAGTPQSAAINVAFTTALQATVKDSSNLPLDGVSVSLLHRLREPAESLRTIRTQSR